MPEGSCATPRAGLRFAMAAKPRTAAFSERSADLPNKPKARGERLPVPAGWRCVIRRATLILCAGMAGIKCLCRKWAAPSHGQAHVAPEAG